MPGPASFLAVVGIAPAIVASLLIASLSSGPLLPLLVVPPWIPASLLQVNVHGLATLEIPRPSRRRFQSCLVKPGARGRQPRGQSARGPDTVAQARPHHRGRGRRHARGSRCRPGPRGRARAARCDDSPGVLLVAVTVLCSPWGAFQLARGCSRYGASCRTGCSASSTTPTCAASSLFRAAIRVQERRGPGVLQRPGRLPEVRREISGSADWALGTPRSASPTATSARIKATSRPSTPWRPRPSLLAAFRRRCRDAPGRARAGARPPQRTRPQDGIRGIPPRPRGAGPERGRRSVRVILTRTMDDLAASSTGPPRQRRNQRDARHRKSTLIRWLCTERNAAAGSRPWAST